VGVAPADDRRPAAGIEQDVLGTVVAVAEGRPAALGAVVQLDQQLGKQLGRRARQPLPVHAGEGTALDPVEEQAGRVVGRDQPVGRRRRTGAASLLERLDLADAAAGVGAEPHRQQRRACRLALAPADAQLVQLAVGAHWLAPDPVDANVGGVRELVGEGGLDAPCPAGEELLHVRDIQQRP